MAGRNAQQIIVQIKHEFSADLARMARAGVSCFLIGEALMRQKDVAAATAALLTKDRA